jgi:hypothetical protein
MLGLEPAVVGAAEFVEGSAFDHDRCSTMGDPIMAPVPRPQSRHGGNAVFAPCDGYERKPMPRSMRYNASAVSTIAKPSMTA